MHIRGRVNKFPKGSLKFSLVLVEREMSFLEVGSSNKQTYRHMEFLSGIAAIKSFLTKSIFHYLDFEMSSLEQG